MVITSIMEHHSNDLPHRKFFKKLVHVPTVMTESGFGCVDVSQFENALKEYGDRVNYISITGVSNVTGIVNPIYEIAELAHRIQKYVNEPVRYRSISGGFTTL